MPSSEMLERMVRRSQRKGSFPIRNAFVQGGSRRRPSPGPLADFVHKHDALGLDLFLLLLTLATGEPHAVKYPAPNWARVLKVGDVTRISRAWKRLEGRNLVVRSREGRAAKVTLRKDDGSGETYVHPATSGDGYGKVPLAYWNEGYHHRLDLPSKAMLLVTVCWAGPLVLPLEKAKAFYGLSPDTCERGFAGLDREGILSKSKEWKESLHSPTGYTGQNVYALKGPFARRRREEPPDLAIVG